MCIRDRVVQPQPRIGAYQASPTGPEPDRRADCLDQRRSRDGRYLQSYDRVDRGQRRRDQRLALPWPLGSAARLHGITLVSPLLLDHSAQARRDQPVSARRETFPVWGVLPPPHLLLAGGVVDVAVELLDPDPA